MAALEHIHQNLLHVSLEQPMHCGEKVEQCSMSTLPHSCQLFVVNLNLLVGMAWGLVVVGRMVDC